MYNIHYMMSLNVFTVDSNGIRLVNHSLLTQRKNLLNLSTESLKPFQCSVYHFWDFLLRVVCTVLILIQQN